MLLLVGLGNPGAEHALNRHNYGFLVVDTIVEEYGFSPWRSKFQALISEGKLSGEKVLAMKPQTYMNLSGDAVAQAVRFYKLEPEDVVVVHDELALEPGKVRVKTGGGTAGHNGIKDIGARIGLDFRRVRIGIGHPGNKGRVEKYVLSNFPIGEQDDVADIVGAISDAIPLMAEGRDSEFMNQVTLKTTPKKTPKAASGKDKTAKDDNGL